MLNKLNNLINKTMGSFQKNKVVVEKVMQAAYDLGKKEAREEEEKIEKGQEYWYISAWGDKVRTTWHNTGVNKANLAIGNVFKNEQKCADKIAGLKAIQVVKRYIKKHFGVFIPDWENSKQKKYYIIYNYDTSRITFDYCYYYKMYSPIGYLEYGKQCEQLTANCNELKTIYK